MSSDHKRFHFSVTCETQDPAVLHCLRALCQFAEKGTKPQIGWGGTSEAAWKTSGGQLTLRFTSASYREAFLSQATRLLSSHWKKLRTNDDDPATPQR
jgi:hypothetical protein